MNKTVLVTGGAGYIGSHLCKALAAAGYEPVTYDSLELGHKAFVRFGPLVQGNILDKSLLISTIKQFQPVSVFHLAAYTNARCLQEEIPSYYENNFIGTQTVLEALQECPPSSFIFSSSASVYGFGGKDPISESSPTKPLSHYGKTKLACENLISTSCEKLGIAHGILRYFNVAGADRSGEIGENHNPETHLIPFLIQVLQQEKEHFPLLVDDHPTHDGSAKRDFIHVSDLAQAHVDTLQWLEKHKKPLTLNLGSGLGHTILDVVAHLEKIMQKKIKVQKASPIQEPACLVADISRAKSLLGWEPKHSDLSTILTSALNWHLSFNDKGG